MAAHALDGKRIFTSGSVPGGKVILLAECGRVMSVPDLDGLNAGDLDLGDQVCLNMQDAERLGISDDGT